MPYPSADPAVARAAVLSTVAPVRVARSCQVPRQHRPAGPVHSPAAPHWSPVSPLSGDVPLAPHATALSSPGSPGCRSASPRCAAAPARSSTALDPDGARPHERQNLPPATARYPLAPKKSGSAPSVPLTTATDGTGPSRLPRETNGTRPAAIHRPSSLRPRSNAPRRPTPKTAADAPAALQEAAPATAACPAAPAPNGRVPGRGVGRPKPGARSEARG